MRIQTQTYDYIEFPCRNYKGVGDLKKELTYFQNNRKRMNYAEVTSVGFPIGSGAVEAANKVLFTARMKRSRQSWGRTNNNIASQC